ncbi:MAG: kinase/pyrophosphorylase [Alphaproteobacteria bacterium]|nr:kinase/pyrophosphorylase [Alphaproteobacteria bacterium]
MPFHLHLVSDATGETIESLIRACLVQFEDVKIKKHHWNLIRSPLLLQTVLDGISDNRGLVFYTFVDENLRAKLEEFCHTQGIPCLSVLRPVLRAMIAHFGKNPEHQPGKQHTLDADYFARIDAMDFAMEQDDGHGEEKLQEADVIVLGVSRTSKTPTCVYLAGRGIRAANIPYVPGHSLPDLTKLNGPLIVGLTKDAESLIAVRRNRLHLLSEKRDTAYVDPEQVRAELKEARQIFARLGCPVIDVSRRSIEETAAEIMMLLSRKKVREGEKREIEK